MKKTFVGLLLAMVLVLGGCTGFQPNVIVDNITDAGFVLTLQNNPSYKPAVIDGLNKMKEVLAKDSLTYTDLIAQLTKLFKSPKYGFVFYLLTRNIQTDAPIMENPLNKAYRDGIIKKIDDLIFLANTYVP